MLPTTVSPRYAPAEDRQGVGRAPAEAVNPPVEWSLPYGLELAVEVRMSSAIRAVESPSHPVSVEANGCRATVRLGGRRTALDRDFVLLVRSAESETPKCVLEREADGTAAAKIVFPPLEATGAAPGEVLFLVDRSGSMDGSSIDEARSALSTLQDPFLTSVSRASTIILRFETGFPGAFKCRGGKMSREAKLFERFEGSPARALLRMKANIPPNWIERARGARKRREDDLVPAIRKLQKIRRSRPNAMVQIKAAQAELKLLLKDWEISYRKEVFYNGLRILLELSRDGKTER